MVSVFKASNIKISVLVVLCCTAGKLVLPLAVVYIDAAFSVPPLVFVAAATAPPLVIGARTRNFRIQRSVPFQHDRSPAPSPFIAIKGPLTKQKRGRRQSETCQKKGKKRQLTYTSSFGRPFFSQPTSPKPNGKATGSIAIFHASRPDMAMKLLRLLLLMLGSFLLALILVSAVDVSDRPQGPILVSNEDCDLLWRKVVQSYLSSYRW